MMRLWPVSRYGASALLLGVTYKPNVPDIRNSPAWPIAALLRHEGASVSFHDPYVDHWSVDGIAVTPASVQPRWERPTSWYYFSRMLPMTLPKFVSHRR